MKTLSIFLVSFLVISCAAQERKPEPTAQKWKNVDGELKSGAKKAKGLLERMGILSSDDSESEVSDGSGPIVPPSNSSSSSSSSMSSAGQENQVKPDQTEGGIWASIKGGLNNGWNQVVGFFTGVGERKSSEED